MINTQQLLTKAEAAAILRISMRTMDRCIKNGQIKPIRIGGRWKFPSDILSVINPNDKKAA